MYYCICKPADKGRRVVCQTPPHDCIVQDYISPLTRDYFGRWYTPNILAFDSVQEARDYMARPSNVAVKDWDVREYDACSCYVGKVVQV